MEQHRRSHRERFAGFEKGEQERSLDRWEQRKRSIGGITHRTVGSPAHIAERRNMPLEDLGNILRRETAELAEELKNACSVEPRHLPLIADLHDLWHARKEGNPELVNAPWAASLDSLDSFIAEFAPHATLHARAYIGMHIAWFVKEYTGNPGSLTIYPWRKNLEGERTFTEEEIAAPSEIAPPRGDWVFMPNAYPDRVEHYLDRSVLKEIIALLESDYQPPDYSHASGSAALPGIAEEGGLLNSLELLEKRKPLETGERSQNMATDAEELHGHGSIFADYGDPRCGYNTLRWFDQYHVSFGISKERQNAYMRTTDVRYEDSHDPEQLSHDTIMNEGTLIGRRVPLESIEYVYAWQNRKGDAEKWAKAHCPWARVIGLEAIQALHSFGGDIGRIAQEEAVEPLEIWKRIAREG